MISKLFKGLDENEVGACLFLIFISVVASFIVGLMVEGVSGDGMSLSYIGFTIVFLMMFLFFMGIMPTNNKERKYLWGTAGILFLIVPTIIFFFVHLTSLIPTWGTALVVLVLFIFLTEILFWLDKRIPKKRKDVFSFTCKRKLEAATEAGLLTVVAGTTGYILREYNLLEKIKQFFIALWEWFKVFIIDFLKVLGVGLLVTASAAIVIFLVYLYIRLNSLKYKNAFKKKKKKRSKK